MESDQILRKVELANGVETKVAAWCHQGLWTAAVSQRGWRRTYQVDGGFSKAKSYEEALAFTLKLATDREALRTPESDEIERLEQLEHMKRFRASSEFADLVRAYRAAVHSNKFDDDVMTEWRINLEKRTDSDLTFAWLMEHMDRQARRDSL